MKRHEAWRLAYRGNRYLRHLDQEELNERGSDTFNVILTLTLDGKVAPLDMKEYGSEAMERWTHYLEESSLRGLPLEPGMTGMRLKETIPDFAGDLAKRAAAALLGATRCHKADLVKFGKAKYFRPLLEEGKLRIQGASSFSDPQHNRAVGDNELARSFKLAIRGEELLKLITRHGLPREAAQRNDLEINVEYFTDYWVTCFTTVLQPRLALDFGADAMLAVFDKREFRRRLRNAFRAVSDYHIMRDGPVQYFDPYLPRCDFRAIPLIKPFKYYYQHEYRFFWLPKTPAKRLEYVEVEMGDLSDIAELVTW